MDEEQRKQANLKDVKIALLKEHIEKAKSKQLEILKGPLKRVNRECDMVLNEVLKLRHQFDKLEQTNRTQKTHLDNYYSID